MSTDLPSAKAVFACALFLVGCAAANPYEGVPAEELLSRAELKVQEEDWGDAIELLERLTITFPTFERIADARLMLADAYFQDEQYFISESLYGDFLNRHRGDERAPEAALGMCRSVVARSPVYQRDQTDTRRAVVVCQQVAIDWAGIDDEVSFEAAEHVNEMRYKLGQKAYEDADYYRRFSLDAAIVSFENVVEQYPDTPWAPRSMLQIIRAYEELGYSDEVAEWTERLVNSYPDSPEAKEIGDGPGGDGEGRGNGAGT